MRISVSDMTRWSHADLFRPSPLTLCDARVYCACCRVVIPLVSSGSDARMDSAGYPACENCGKRLNRCKGMGHICQSCIDNQRRGARGAASATLVASIDAAASTSTRSPKRARLDTGQQQSQPAVTIAPPPSPASRWHTHAWMVIALVRQMPPTPLLPPRCLTSLLPLKSSVSDM
jgi:hypothetical protein